MNSNEMAMKINETKAKSDEMKTKQIKGQKPCFWFFFFLKMICLLSESNK